LYTLQLALHGDLYYTMRVNYINIQKGEIVMPSPINWDEQKRQQEFRNWKTSQQALNQMPKGVKTKGEGRKDRKTLITTIAVLAALFLVLVLLSRLGVI